MKKIAWTLQNVSFMKYKGLRNGSRLKGPKEIPGLGVAQDLGFSFAEMDVILTVGEIAMRSMG